MKNIYKNAHFPRFLTKKIFTNDIIRHDINKIKIVLIELYKILIIN